MPIINMKGGYIMQRFKVRPYYLSLWGFGVTESTRLTIDDIVHYAELWDVPVTVLLAEVDPIE